MVRYVSRMQRTTYGVRRMRSRLTGEKQLYTLSDEYAACERFEADMNVLKSGIQSEFDSQGIDVIVEDCKHLRSLRYDYLLIEQWVPYGSPLDPITWLVILAILKTAIPIIIAGIVIVAVLWSVRTYLLGPYPKFVCDICGAEFDTLSGLIAHRRTEHPGEAPYQCPYCGMTFNSAEELAAHMEECNLKPSEIPEWLPWAIAGIIGIAVIVIVPKVL